MVNSFEQAFHLPVVVAHEHDVVRISEVLPMDAGSNPNPWDLDWVQWLADDTWGFETPFEAHTLTHAFIVHSFFIVLTFLPPFFSLRA